MATKPHRMSDRASNHAVHSLVYANATERALAVLAATDVGRIALQQDTAVFWILTSHAPTMWRELGGTGGAGGSFPTDAAGVAALFDLLASPLPPVDGRRWWLNTSGVPDDVAPIVTAFTVPPTSASTTVPISTFTATDAYGVTGYLVTESATPPLASDPGWTAQAPTQFTCAGSGTRTLYGWAKDAAGNVSASMSDTVEIAGADTTAPVVTAFDVPATSDTVVVPIITLTATDAVGVTGYKVTESATPPLAGDAGWSASAPAEFTVGGGGARTLYAWAKDAAGNVSAAATDSCTVTLPDANAPFVDTFADASLDANHWAGSGTNPPVETTLLTLATTATAQTSHLALKQPIEKATHTWAADLDSSSTFSLCTWWQITQRPAQPVPRSGGTADSTYRIYIMCKNSGASRLFSAGWQNTSNAHQAFLTDNGLGYTGSVRVVLETTATQWRLRILRLDTLAELYASVWINWSSVRDDASPLWLEMGDIYTDTNIASVKLTRFERT